MKLTRSKKIIVMVILIVCTVLLLNSNTLFAAINDTYVGDYAVTADGLDDAVGDSSILKTLAHLIFAVGQFLEWILGVIFKLLTGNSDFPWADKIVFNAVPLLDVNFINPSSGSFVGNTNIQQMLQNLYATILAIAVTFFGITVLITAIKLVISTIASDKAKYKQAIVDWLVGLVTIFCIHYFISFVFYLNEQLVVVASKIVSSQLDLEEQTAATATSAAATELIKSIGDMEYDGWYLGKQGWKIKDVLLDTTGGRNNVKILEEYINLDSSTLSTGIHEMLHSVPITVGTGGFSTPKIDWDIPIGSNEQIQRMTTIIAWAAEENIYVDELKDIRENKIFIGYSMDGYGQAVTDDTIKDIFASKTGETGWKYNKIVSILDPTISKNTGCIRGKRGLNWDSLLDFKETLFILTYESKHASQEYVDSISNGEHIWISKGSFDISNNQLLSGTFEAIKVFLRASPAYLLSPFKLPDEANTSFKWIDVIDDLIKLKEASATHSSNATAGTGTKNRLISNLASYFKQNATDAVDFRPTKVTGLKKTGNINVQNMIMYSVLVGQSLILFIAYVKRLFYVVLLAMMAPIVVVFDFFQKFGK